MTTVNVNEDKYSVTVTEGATTVVTVKSPGPQGPGFPDGNLGDVTSSNTGASVVINSGAITNAKVSASAGIQGTKISPDFGSQNITTTGNAVFGGNLTVSGELTVIDTTTLRVEDKNIELGKVGSPTDITADGGGITLLGDTNHTFNWLNATDSWTSSEHIALPNNKKLQLGDSQDLSLLHDGTDSKITNTTGNLLIEPKSGETGIKVIPDGGVQLFHNNVKRAEALSTSFNIYGKAYVAGEIAAFNCRFFQSGNDLFIDNNNGGSANRYTQIMGGTLGTSSGYIKLYNAGQVELYHNSVKKAETTANGFNILSGTTTVGASILSSSSISNHSYGHGINGFNNQGLTIRAEESCLELISSAGGQHAGSILIRDSSNDGFGFVNDPTNEELQLKSFTTSADNFFISSSGTNVSRLDDCIVIKKDGSVSLFHDGSKKFETKNYGFVSESFSLDPNILVHRVGHSRGGLVALQTQRLALATTTSGDDIVFGFGSAEPVTSSNFTERMRIDNGTGNVGIGTSSATERLDVMGTIKAVNKVNIHDNGTSTPKLQFTNSLTGTGTEDGFRIGYSTNSNVAFFIAGESNSGFQVKTGGSGANDERLNISNTGVFTVKSNSENMLVATPNAGVELLFNGTKKAETVSTGLDVDGNVIANNLIVANGISHEGQTNTNIAFDGTAIKFQSNGVQRLSIGQFAAFVATGYKLAFTASSGENPTIKSGGTNNGDLLIESGSESMAQFKRNGPVELFHNGVKRCETSADGITVTDRVTCAAITISDGQPGLVFEDTGANPDFILQNRNGTFAIRDFTSNVNRFLVNMANGEVTTTGSILPDADNTDALGSSTKRFSTLHINSVKASTGILFGSDTADDNKLNDYEQGTFTPTLEGSSSNPTVTYTSQSGHYTKIGNVVHIQVYVGISSFTGGSGEWQCGGLPFTASSTAPGSFNFNWNQNNAIDWYTGTRSLAFYISGGTSRVRGRRFASNTNNPLNLANFSSTTALAFGIHGSYIAA